MSMKKPSFMLSSIAASCAAITVGAVIGAGASLFSIALDTQSSYSLFKRKHDPRYRSFDNTVINREDNQWFTYARHSMTLRVHGGPKLHGWLFDPDCAHPRSHCYAICMHGYTGEPKEMAVWAHHYAKMGFTVLVPAQRAHERSEGRYVGMGWLEQQDLIAWIQAIVAKDNKARILLHGNSMGAATVMMACGNPALPRNVIAAIEDSGYCGEREQLTNNVAGFLHMPSYLTRWIVDAASCINKIKLGFFFSQANVLQQLQHSTTPLLCIQGTTDTIIRPSDIHALYKANTHAYAQKLIVDGAGHTASLTVDPQRYWNTVDTFINRWFTTK